MAERRVLIVGGGIAGATLAIGLAQLGVKAEIAEIEPEWSVAGLGIALQGPALRALEPLGVVDAILERGFPYSEVQIHDVAGTPRTAIPLPRLLGPDRPAACGIMRPELRAILAGRVEQAGIPVRLGVSVAALADAGDETRDAGDGARDAGDGTGDAGDGARDGVVTEFSDGSRARHDVVVGADGAYSRVRALIFGDGVRPEFQGQLAWRALVPRRADTPAICYGEHNSAGYNIVSDDLMYVYLIQNVTGRVRIPAGQLAQTMRAELAGFGGLIAESRAEISRPEQIVMRPIETHLLPRPWYRGNVILIGDAAHAPSPNLATGATIAIEDAALLAAGLAEERPLSEVFELFMERRWERCRAVVGNSVQIGVWQRQNRQAHDPAFAELINRTNALLAQPM